MFLSSLTPSLSRSLSVSPYTLSLPLSPYPPPPSLLSVYIQGDTVIKTTCYWTWNWKPVTFEQHISVPCQTKPVASLVCSIMRTWGVTNHLKITRTSNHPRPRNRPGISSVFRPKCNLTKHCTYTFKLYTTINVYGHAGLLIVLFVV